MTNRRTPTANPKAPNVEMRVVVSQPSPAGYVYTRRGIPMSPDRCIGKNATLKNRNITQKFHRPSCSLNIRPVIFGNQE